MFRISALLIRRPERRAEIQRVGSVAAAVDAGKKRVAVTVDVHGHLAHVLVGGELLGEDIDRGLLDVSGLGLWPSVARSVVADAVNAVPTISALKLYRRSIGSGPRRGGRGSGMPLAVAAAL